jgi:hypothetical protein
MTVPNSYLVAVSNGADPTEGWTGFQIDSDPTDTTYAHYSSFGMDADGLYVVAQRNSGGPWPAPYVGASLLVFPKADLLLPTPSIANATSWPSLTPSQVGFNPQPVVNLDGAGLPATLLSGNLAFLGFLQSTEIGGSIGSPVLASSKLIPVSATAQTPFRAPQLGPKADLDAGFVTFSGSAVQVSGSIWATQTTRVDGRLAVRWYEIDAATDILLHSGDLTDPTLDLYFPSIAVNQFDLVVIGMSGSSENDYVGAYAAVGETLGGVTTFGAALRLQAGRDDYERIIPTVASRNMWGQYSATVVDPSDPHRFWTFQECVQAEDTYAVRITELILIPEPGTALLLGAGVVGLATLGRKRLRS